MNKQIEDILNERGELTYTNRGTSMLPMLREKRDVFTIKKKTDRCRENDVVLFKLNGKYILHRVVKVYADHYTMLGDNCESYERNIKEEDVIGVLVSFYRDGKSIKTDDQRYSIYVFFLRLFERPRILCKRMLSQFKRKIKSLIR